MRVWAGLTQKSFEDSTLRPVTSDSTLSRYETGAGLPRQEWIHDFLDRCLTRRWGRKPGAHQLAAELRPWIIARAHLTTTHEAPAIPAQTSKLVEPADDIFTAEDEPECVHPPVVVAGRGTATWTSTRTPRWDRSRRSPRWACWTLGGACVALAAMIVIAASSGTPRHTAETMAMAMFGDPAPAHNTGSADNLLGNEGIDLDTGQRRLQRTPGVDISFSDRSTALYATGNRAKIALLPDAGSEDPRRCADVHWTRENPIPDIYDLPEGRQVCVTTDEKRTAILTITERASPATGTIDIRYSTWN
ncbi:hypothetical protein ALI144C_42000 [Actinosynnema sp. ALI-1.44]|nr:hypothetical protein ALI144C_42000 [Actinosynnema sp. ALI-1.44]